MPITAIEVLETYRKTHRYSQFEMATSLNVSQATYNNWINLKHEVNIRHYPAIAALCGVSVQEILPPGFGHSDSTSA